MAVQFQAPFISQIDSLLEVVILVTRIQFRSYRPQPYREPKKIELLGAIPLGLQVEFPGKLKIGRK